MKCEVLQLLIYGGRHERKRYQERESVKDWFRKPGYVDKKIESERNITYLEL
jgi:hypothetical protein